MTLAAFVVLLRSKIRPI